jgi:hypothetical protein
MILIMRNRRLRASQTRLNISVKQTPSRFSYRVVTRHLAAQTESLSQLHQQDRGYVVCFPCVSRRRDALCVSISLIVPLPLIIFPVSSLKLQSHMCSSGSSRERKSGAARDGRLGLVVYRHSFLIARCAAGVIAVVLCESFTTR